MGKSRTGRASGAPAAAITPRVVVISGLSGSGKTVALRAVEDLNFFCVDNLPVSLIGSLVSKVSGRPPERDIAIGVDIREKEFFDGIDRALGVLRKKYRVEILFLEAETEVLIRRFKETRRPHPLGGSLEESIRSERASLEPLRQNADRIIDTSSYTPHQLRGLVSSVCSSGDGGPEMSVTIISFGFKYGAPQNVDMLFDIRFLPNPHFVPSLRDLNGTNRRVAKYVFAGRDTLAFMKKVKDLLSFLLPRYQREGRSYLSIGIGCTGGNHRSPAVAEELARFIGSGKFTVHVVHRDMS
ncbi:MAG: RNase adapter RapZ [Nitrospiraceae bacterium]|nr:RNase adapter RapZ [Nitrospiraceae bacterium]